MNLAGTAEAREGWRGEVRTSKDRGEAGYIVMLGRRQVVPRWENATVQRHVGGGGVGSGGG